MEYVVVLRVGPADLQVVAIAAVWEFLGPVRAMLPQEEQIALAVACPADSMDALGPVHGHSAVALYLYLQRVVLASTDFGLTKNGRY